MKNGDKIEFPCGASAEVVQLEKDGTNPKFGLAVIQLRGLAYTEFNKKDNTLDLRFQNRAIPVLIAALQGIQRELNG